MKVSNFYVLSLLKVIKNLENEIDDLNKKIFSPDELTTEKEIYNSSFYINTDVNEFRKIIRDTKDSKKIYNIDPLTLPFTTNVRSYNI